MANCLYARQLEQLELVKKIAMTHIPVEMIRQFCASLEGFNDQPDTSLKIKASALVSTFNNLDYGLKLFVDKDDKLYRESLETVRSWFIKTIRTHHELEARWKSFYASSGASDVASLPSVGKSDMRDSLKQLRARPDTSSTCVPVSRPGTSALKPGFSNPPESWIAERESGVCKYRADLETERALEGWRASTGEESTEVTRNLISSLHRNEANVMVGKPSKDVIPIASAAFNLPTTPCLPDHLTAGSQLLSHQVLKGLTLPVKTFKIPAAINDPRFSQLREIAAIKLRGGLGLDGLERALLNPELIPKGNKLPIVPRLLLNHDFNDPLLAPKKTKKGRK